MAVISSPKPLSGAEGDGSSRGVEEAAGPYGNCSPFKLIMLGFSLFRETLWLISLLVFNFLTEFSAVFGTHLFCWAM